MDPKTGYYLLLKDVENPEFSSGTSWWGMFSSYVYTSEDVPPSETLALRGELLEARKPDEQPEDANKIALQGVKQIFQHVECDCENVKRLTYEEAQLLLAVNSYSERCRIVGQGCLAVGCSLEEGAKVSVRIKDIKKDVSAIVRYKGPVTPYDGTMFGVEILDQRYKRQGTCDGTIQCKRYFSCSPGGGLFVALDKLCSGNTSLPEKEANKDEKDTLLLEAKELDVEDTNKNETCGIESKEKNLCNELKTSEETQDNGITDNSKEVDEESIDKMNENDPDEISNEEVEKVEPCADGAELKCVVDDLEQQLMKIKTELQEKEKKWKQENMELEMKLGTQAVAQNEKIMHLEKMVQDLQVARVEAEEKLLEEQKSKKQQRKAFNREWDEFERRLLEERTLRTNIELQHTRTQAQLTEEVSRKASLQEELEQLQRSFTQKEQDFERHKQYYEYRIRELEAAGESNPTNLSTSTNPTNDEHDDTEPCDWIINRDEIHVTDKTVGKGAWGQVFEGTFRGCPVAVKKIYDLILSPHNRRLFEREMSIASRCRHPCLLQFIGATNDNGSPLFITELLDTNLRAVLETRPLSDLEVFSIALDVARALNYLHLNKPNPIIHRDISSANVLLWKRDDRWRAKVSDYGAANFMRQCRTVNPGAVIYSAPEAFSVQQTPKIDVYSFGLLLCEMAIRELPVPDQTQRQLALVANPMIKDFVARSTKENHEERPTMEEIVRDLTSHLTQNV